MEQEMGLRTALLTEMISLAVGMDACDAAVGEMIGYGECALSHLSSTAGCGGCRV